MSAFFAGAATAATLAAEISCQRVADATVARPITARVVAGALLLMVAGLVIEEVIKSQRARDWNPLIAAGLEDLAAAAEGIAWELSSVLADATPEDEPWENVDLHLDPWRAGQALERILDADPSWVDSRFHDYLRNPLSAKIGDLGAAARRWAPLVPADDRLASCVADALRVEPLLRLVNLGLGEPTWRDDANTSAEDQFLPTFVTCMEVLREIRRTASGGSSDEDARAWRKDRMRARARARRRPILANAGRLERGLLARATTIATASLVAAIGRASRSAPGTTAVSR